MKDRHGRSRVQLYASLIITLSTTLLTGCATIVKSVAPEKIHLTSEPSGASAVGRGFYGNVVFNGQTPLDIDRYPQRGDLVLVTLTKDGKKTEKPLIPELNPWFVGNIGFLIFAPVGMIVDYFSGSLMRYPPSINIIMDDAPAPNVVPVWIKQ